jgi:hypothetical protein
MSEIASTSHSSAPKTTSSPDQMNLDECPNIFVVRF